jgi:hypothetical protein
VQKPVIVVSPTEWCFVGPMEMEGAFRQQTMVIGLGIAWTGGAEVSGVCACIEACSRRVFGGKPFHYVPCAF